MSLHGNHLIAGKPVAPEGPTFNAISPNNSQPLEPAFGDATEAQIDAAFQAAEEAFDGLRTATPEIRATFLDLLADKIVGLGDALLDRAHAETGLPMARLTGERGRAVGQCKLFASLIRDGSWADARIDHAIPDRQPLPKPDVRRVMQPIGPVAVFGASNFPFAIGVVGTDTICALAAGCSVVVKGHPAHPGTSELLASAVYAALEEAGLPAGSFNLMHGKSNKMGTALVKHPLANAVAFTGSLKGGRALMDIAAARPTPIPFYGEMGSINPVFLLPGALKARAAQIGEAYVGSVTMGVGQFCTNPALVLGVQGVELDAFVTAASAAAEKAAPATMLHGGIRSMYCEGTAAIASTAGVSIAGQSDADPSDEATQAECVIFTTDLATLEANDTLRHEVFGPCSIVTNCPSKADVLRFAKSMEGQLTATIHGTPEDLIEHSDLIRVLERKVGRIVFNGFPTGIEVCPSMHHGGPYPSASHSFFTSIGTASIYRFVRPVCYQGFPDESLPELLKAKNTRNAIRLVDGAFTKDDA
ncbi:MAG: aldH [Verrucomicrobiaceae bacterium]|nr:aldH [Verrucomicrobiaceae bacterium]